jgi:hypothetical protein
MAKEKVMIAVRRVQDVIAGVVTIKLPADFRGKRVEVIVLPLEENDQEPQQLQRLLLTAPTLSEDDLQGFAQIRDWMNQWTVNEF